MPRFGLRGGRDDRAPLFFISVLFHPTVGGSIRWVDQLCRQYDAGKVAILSQEHGLPHEPVPSPFRIHRVRLFTIPWLRPESIPLYRNLDGAAVRLARTHGTMIVAASRVVPEGLVAMRLHRRLGIPFVVLAHGEEITVPERSRRRWMTRLMKLSAMRLVYRRASRVIANSDHTAQTVREFAGPGVSLRVLHPGMDPNRFVPEGDDLRTELGLGDRPVVLTVGQLMRRKGQSAVIEAFDAVRRRVPDAIYLVAGTGPDEAELRRLAAAHGGDDVVRILGTVSEEDLPRLYRTANVFILANRNLPNGDHEGFGIVYQEAAACGRPVIFGERTGNVDAVIEGITALHADPESRASLADTIVRLLTDQALAACMGRAGRAFVVERFSPAALAKQWNDILREVHAESRQLTAPS